MELQNIKMGFSAEFSPFQSIYFVSPRISLEASCY